MAKETKFCVLPGQDPVRIAKTDGRVVLIGEEPRTVPADLHAAAIGHGAVTEETLADLGRRLSGANQKTAEAVEAKGKQVSADSEARIEQIKLATIEVLNAGNPDDLTAHRKPKIEVLEDLSGLTDIAGHERDAAFEALQKG